MKNICANYVYISANEIIKNGIVTIDDKDKIISVNSIDNLVCEPHSAFFFNGIITFFNPIIPNSTDTDLLSFLKKTYPNGAKPENKYWINKL